MTSLPTESPHVKHFRPRPSALELLDQLAAAGITFGDVARRAGISRQAVFLALRVRNQVTDRILTAATALLTETSADALITAAAAAADSGDASAAARCLAIAKRLGGGAP